MIPFMQSSRTGKMNLIYVETRKGGVQARGKLLGARDALHLYGW